MYDLYDDHTDSYSVGMAAGGSGVGIFSLCRYNPKFSLFKRPSSKASSPPQHENFQFQTSQEIRHNNKENSERGMNGDKVVHFFCILVFIVCIHCFCILVHYFFALRLDNLECVVSTAAPVSIKHPCPTNTPQRVSQWQVQGSSSMRMVSHLFPRIFHPRPPCMQENFFLSFLSIPSYIFPLAIPSFKKHHLLSQHPSQFIPPNIGNPSK